MNFYFTLVSFYGLSSLLREKQQQKLDIHVGAMPLKTAALGIKSRTKTQG